MIFLKIFIIAILIIITLNTLEYLWKTLKYGKFLDYLNIIYTIASIISSSFKDCKLWILLKIDNIGNIIKFLIFINSIKKDIALEIYL